MGSVIHPGSSVGTSAQVFIGGWSYRHPLPSMCQKSRLPKGKQVFGINHVVCQQIWHSEPYLSIRQWWELPKIRVPRCQSKAPLAGKPFRGQLSQAGCFNSSAHTHTDVQGFKSPKS